MRFFGIRLSVSISRRVKYVRLVNDVRFHHSGRVEAPCLKSANGSKSEKSDLHLYAVIRLQLFLSGRRIARADGWTCERETVHPEEEWQDISESTSKTQIHENCGKIPKFGNIWDHLW